MQPCNEGETASTATWSPDGHHIAIICNGKSPRDLEAAKAEKTKTGSGKTGDEEAKGEKPLESKVIVRSEEHTSELQSLMRISYAVFCLKKKTRYKNNNSKTTQ